MFPSVQFFLLDVREGGQCAEYDFQGGSSLEATCRMFWGKIVEERLNGGRSRTMRGKEGKGLRRSLAWVGEEKGGGGRMSGEEKGEGLYTIGSKK